MRRIKLTLGYIGTAYSGWQRQIGQDTVQERLERAVSLLTKEQVSVQGSGRTDTGVHAIGQVAHFDTESSIPIKNFVTGLNHFLPDDIRITSAEETDGSFHARYSAKEKTYCYALYEGETDIAVLANRAVRVKNRLSVAKMQRAATAFVGEHDFRSFQSTNADTTTSVRTVKSVRVVRKDGLIRIYATANGFLYNMVRLMVGTLVRAGKGEIDADGIKELIARADKHAVTEVMPACGLYLVEVKY